MESNKPFYLYLLANNGLYVILSGIRIEQTGDIIYEYWNNWNWRSWWLLWG
jgi:hypothetical protein